jgi:hypothetical protein
MLVLVARSPIGVSDRSRWPETAGIRWIEEIFGGPPLKFCLRLALASMSCLFAAGCIHTEEMPLAPNVVRLDTQASGLLFAGQATSQTMKRAAELTLQNGYSHFRLDQADLSQGSQLAGVYGQSQGVASGHASGMATGNVYTGNAAASYSGSSFATPIYRRTTSVGATVIMFHESEPGAKGAFDAAEVLRRNS